MSQSSINLGQISIYDKSPVLHDQRCLIHSYIPKPPGFKLKTYIKKVIKLIYLWSFWHLKKTINNVLSENPKCIAVASGSNLGGAIISLPLIEAVRKRWPNSHLIIIANTQHSLDIVKYAGIGDDFIIAPTVSFKSSFFNSKVLDFQNLLQNFAIDIFISNHNFTLDFLLAPLKIPFRIGSTGNNIYGDLLEWDGLYNIPVACKRGINWLDSYSDIAKKFQESDLASPKIYVSNKDKIDARLKFLDSDFSKDTKFVAVQAGVWEQHSFKQWPIELLVKTCKSLLSDYGLIPIVFGVRGQEDTAEMLQNELTSSSVLNLVGKTSPSEAASVISQCSVCIANDSGLMHLSVAVGTPTVFLCGVTDLTWVYGHKKNCRIIRHSDCLPCYAINRHLVNSCKNKPCLSAIQSKTVVSAVDELLRSINN